MVPSAPLRFDTDSHAWRVAKIVELGTRMGGFRSVTDSAIECFGPAYSSTDSQYLGNEDPEDVAYLVAIANAFLYLIGARNRFPDSDFAARTWRSLVNDGVVELYLDIVQSQGFLAEDAVSFLSTLHNRQMPLLMSVLSTETGVCDPPSSRSYRQSFERCLRRWGSASVPNAKCMEVILGYASYAQASLIRGARPPTRKIRGVHD